MLERALPRAGALCTCLRVSAFHWLLRSCGTVPIVACARFHQKRLVGAETKPMTYPSRGGFALGLSHCSHCWRAWRCFVRWGGHSHSGMQRFLSALAPLVAAG